MNTRRLMELIVLNIGLELRVISPRAVRDDAGTDGAGYHLAISSIASRAVADVAAGCREIRKHVHFALDRVRPVSFLPKRQSAKSQAIL